MLSIHVPMREIIWPLKKSWKLRCFSERTMSRNRERSSIFLSGAFAVSICAMLFQLYDAIVRTLDSIPRVLTPQVEKLGIR